MKAFLVLVPLVLPLCVVSPVSAADVRLGAQQTLNGYHPFRPVTSKEAWDTRQARLRIQTQLAAGLYPLPEKTPLNPVIHGKVDRDDYTVEKVYFESLPGHYVTGNLYRPKNPKGKSPGVLSPHGHWNNGRFHDHGEGGVKGEIKNGGEKFEKSGRHPLQARAVGLARLGCVVFHYDMLGYADSIQFPQHRPGIRKHMNTKKDWGLFSPQAELRLQGVLGLQTWNSIRAADFLASLKDVDAGRLAITGGSGGATQTFMAAIIDDRLKAAFPAVMVSTAMQGGCSCENANYLRVGAGNIDLAAAIAPRAVGLTAANDWTKELKTKGHPDLEKHFAMLGIPDRYEAHFEIQFGHNYNYVSRAFMYDFMNRHLKLGFKSVPAERDFVPCSRTELSVWNDAHPRPAGERAGDAHERSVCRWMTAQDERKMPGAVIQQAWETMIGRTLQDVGEVKYEVGAKEPGDGYLEIGSVVTHQGEELAMRFLHPENWNKQVVLWLDPAGKAGLEDPETGKLRQAIRRLLAHGYSVAGIDLLYQGGEKLTAQRMVSRSDSRNPWKGMAGFTYGYNPSLFAMRVHDILTAVAFMQRDQHGADKIHLAGMNGTGHWALAAHRVSGGAIGKLVADTQNFQFVELERIDHPDFLPGAVKYGGIKALTPKSGERVWLASESKAENLELDAADWLMK